MKHNKNFRINNLKKTRLMLLAFVFVMLINLVISFYINFKLSSDFSSTNNLGSCFADSGECGIVQGSSYSKIFGIPLSIIGVVSFALATLIFIALYLSINKLLFKTAGAMMVLGSAFSIWLIYLQIFVINSICKYCLIIDILTIFSGIAFFVFFGKEFMKK